MVNLLHSSMIIRVHCKQLQKWHYVTLDKFHQVPFYLWRGKWYFYYNICPCLDMVFLQSVLRARLHMTLEICNLKFRINLRVHLTLWLVNYVQIHCAFLWHIHLFGPLLSHGFSPFSLVHNGLFPIPLSAAVCLKFSQFTSSYFFLSLI